jgi:pyruvate dehydrogenase E1 component alpha subunit
MRRADYGTLPQARGSFSRAETLALYRNICRSHYFDTCAIDAVRDGRLTYQVYLSLGQEAAPAALAASLSGFQLFTQHRCHAYYLAFGGAPQRLRDELLGRPTGTSGGRAGSNCLQNHDENLTMFGHHGLIGENVPLAVGAALGSGQPVLAVFGDGSAEEDYIYPSLGFAVTHKLPVLFVCEDNDLSILTPTSTRRSWQFSAIAESLGMPAADLADDPWSVALTARQFRDQLPALINVRTCRRHWHVGVGCDGPPEWDRMSLVQEALGRMGLTAEREEIEQEQRQEMERIWNE